MKTLILAIMSMIVAVPEIVRGETATLTASHTVRLVNPEDRTDVRFIYTFDLPPEIKGQHILRAWCDVPTNGTEQVLLSAIPLRTSGSFGTWAELVRELSRIDPREAQVLSNDIEVTESGTADHGVEIRCDALVRDWVDGHSVLGFCLQRASDRAEDVSTVIPENVEIPLLTIIYLSRE